MLGKVEKGGVFTIIMSIDVVCGESWVICKCGSVLGTVALHDTVWIALHNYKIYKTQ